jgi:hypothetical protein
MQNYPYLSAAGAWVPFKGKNGLMVFRLTAQKFSRKQNPSVANPFRSVSDWWEGGFGERDMSSREDLSREP